MLKNIIVFALLIMLPASAMALPFGGGGGPFNNNVPASGGSGGGTPGGTSGQIQYNNGGTFGGVTLTTTGTTGAATMTSGTLNIPQYSSSTFQAAAAAEMQLTFGGL